MAGMEGVVEIEAGQDGEDIGLQRGDQELERGQRDGRGERQDRAEDADEAEPSRGATTKPAKTFSVMWPASMLAKRRIDSEIGREMKESTSIAAMSGQEHLGHAARHEQLEEMELVLPEAVDDDQSG